MANTKKLTLELAEEIRNKFVQGIDGTGSERKYYTLDALAVEYKIPKSTLYRYAQKHSWKGQQERFHSEYLQKLDVERQKQLIHESKEFDSTALKLAKILINEIGLLYNEHNNRRQNDPSYDSLQPDFVDRLSNAALRAQKLGKIALGESTENIKLNTDATNSDAFREAMELLDSYAKQRRNSSNEAIH